MSGCRSERIRVLIADDHKLVRHLLRLALEPQCEVVAEADEGSKAVETAVKTQPDIVVMDLGMPGVGGLDAVRLLARRAPRVKVIVLSQYDDEEYVLESFGAANVGGYVLKSDAAEDLLSAISAVQSGKRFISPSIAPIVLRRLNAQAKRSSDPVQLTARERAVLKFVCEGASAKEIASRLGISPKTVQIHRANLMAKLNVRSTAGLVRWAIKHKIIRLD